MGADIGFDSQVPSLPTGGGGVGGLGETFTPELSTGTGSFNLPLDCPNGPGDIGPRLVLRYDTGTGNGPFGIGWTLPLPRLLRSTANGFPQFTPDDRVMLEGAGELVSLPDGRLRPEVDGGAWRAEVAGEGFRLTDRSGLHYLLGTTDAARLRDSASPASGAAARVYAWHLEAIEDALGNRAVLRWQRDGDQLYLAEVSYGPYTIGFLYEPRPDTLRWGRAGFLVTTALRCHAVELRVPADEQPVVRRWTIEYGAAANGASLLESVVLAGITEDGSTFAAPPVRFGYTGPGDAELSRFTTVNEGPGPGPLSRRDRRVELVDWDGDGLPDLIEIGSGGVARTWINAGGVAWEPPVPVGRLPMFAAPDAAVALADMDGDGVSDLVPVGGRLAGYLPRSVGVGFGPPVRWRQSPSVRPGDPTARFVDLDGDGAVDLLSATAGAMTLNYRTADGGWAAVPEIVSGDHAPPVNLADAHVFVADMTGDGTDDLVRVDGGGVTYWPHLGLGRWASPVVMTASPDLPPNTRAERLFVVDVDGDGCADVVHIDDGVVRLWLNQGGTAFSPPITVPFVPTGSIEEVRCADMRGSGCPGLAWTAPRSFGGGTTWFLLEPLGSSKPYLLDSIDNGVGLVTTIAYTTSAQEAARARAEGDAWRTTLPVVVPVIASIEATDRTTGLAARTTLAYRDGRYDGVLREFAGFARVDVDLHGDASCPTLRTTSWFHVGVEPTQGSDGEPIPGPEPLGDDRARLRALRGRLLRQERFGLDGTLEEDRPYDRLEYAWEVDTQMVGSRPIYRPRLRSTTRSTFERETAPVAVITTANTAWDEAGNVVATEERAEEPSDASAPWVLRTEVSFAHDAGGRFLALPWRTRQFDGTGACVADTVTMYDGQPESEVGSQGLVTRRSALALTDALVQEVYGDDVPDLARLGYYRRPGEDGWWIQQASYQRTDGPDGLRGSVTGPLGATTTLAFDSDHLVATSVTDPYGNTTTAGYDRRLARITAFTDTSGAVSTAHYDALARLVARVDPMDTAVQATTTVDYSTALPAEIRWSRRGTSGTDEVTSGRRRFDGAGRVLEERETDEVGEIVIASRSYNARGLLARTWSSYRAASDAWSVPGDSVPSTSYVYDALGRLLRRVRADGAVATTLRRGLVVELADEEDNRTGDGATHAGTPTLHHLDATGRVHAVEQRLGGRAVVSSQEHDIKGNVVSHRDALKNPVRLWHDALGRLVRVQRPEQDTTTTLDAVGNAVVVRSAGGGDVFREFDACRRLVTLRLNDPAAAPMAEFVYHDAGRPAPADAGAHTSGGRCVRIDDESGTTVLDYDERGRVTRRVITPAGGTATFRMDRAYRSDGLLASMSYPDASGSDRVVSYDYDRRGLLTRIPGVIVDTRHDLAGRRSHTRYANGVEEQRTFDPLTGTLRRLTLVDRTGTVLRDTSLELDLVGNVVGVQSPDADLAATYGYDDMYRLTTATTQSGASWSYAYDDGGNIVHKSDVGDFSYGGGGAPATCLTAAGPGAFTYSPRGEMLKTPWGDQEFDGLGRLRSITGADGHRVTHTYDASGRRVRTQVSRPDSTSLDRLDLEPSLSVVDGVVVLRVLDGGAAVAEIHGDGTMAFLHADHLGSLAVVTDGSGALVMSVRYDPFGAVLSRSGTGAGSDGGADPFGFTGGGRVPGTGLVLLGARYYHPLIGRFVSPDPLVADLLDPMAWSAYVYCGNNPTSAVDRDGLGFWKVFAIVAAIVALTVLTVVTLGATAGIQAAVVIGVIAGGVVGGVAAGMHHGDVVAGALVGAAVGGWGAFLGGAAGAAIGKALTAGSLASDVAAGAANGAVNGAAMGLTSVYAGGGESLDDVMKKIAVAALVGAAVGAGLGALSHIAVTKDVAAASTFEQGRGPGSPPDDPPDMPDAPDTGPYTKGQGSYFADADSKQDPTDLIGPGAKQVMKALGYTVRLGPTATMPLFNAPSFQAIVVDLLAGSAALGYDYAVTYARRHEEIKTPTVPVYNGDL